MLGRDVMFSEGLVVFLINQYFVYRFPLHLQPYRSYHVAELHLPANLLAVLTL